jgi:GNAT superfamily N-acetyltransferase
MVIREARLGDATAMSRVLIASITELCIADHEGNPEFIARWTANKTPESIAGWIGNPAVHNFVGDEAGEIISVGAFRDNEVQINYVAPKARFRGASKAMLAHIERAMSGTGVREGTLTSTETALRFYLAAGWEHRRAAEPEFGMSSGHLMTKALT